MNLQRILEQLFEGQTLELPAMLQTIIWSTFASFCDRLPDSSRRGHFLSLRCFAYSESTARSGRQNLALRRQDVAGKILPTASIASQKLRDDHNTACRKRLHHSSLFALLSQKIIGKAALPAYHLAAVPSLFFHGPALLAHNLLRAVCVNQLQWDVVYVNK